VEKLSKLRCFDRQ